MNQQRVVKAGPTSTTTPDDKKSVNRGAAAVDIGNATKTAASETVGARRSTDSRGVDYRKQTDTDMRGDPAVRVTVAAQDGGVVKDRVNTHDCGPSKGEGLRKGSNAPGQRAAAGEYVSGAAAGREDSAAEGYGKGSAKVREQAGRVGVGVAEDENTGGARSESVRVGRAAGEAADAASAEADGTGAVHAVAAADGGADDIARQEKGPTGAKDAARGATGEESTSSPDIPADGSGVDEPVSSIVNRSHETMGEVVAEEAVVGEKNVSTRRSQGQEADDVGRTGEGMEGGGAKEVGLARVAEGTMPKSSEGGGVGVQVSSELAVQTPADEGADDGHITAVPLGDTEGGADETADEPSSVSAVVVADDAGQAASGVPVDDTAVSRPSTEVRVPRDNVQEGVGGEGIVPEVEVASEEGNSVGERSEEEDVAGAARAAEFGMTRKANDDRGMDEDYAGDAEVEASGEFRSNRQPDVGQRGDDSLADFNPSRDTAGDFFAADSSSEEELTGGQKDPSSTRDLGGAAATAPASSVVEDPENIEEKVEDSNATIHVDALDNDGNVCGPDGEDPPSPRFISSTVTPSSLGRGAVSPDPAGTMGGGFAAPRSPVTQTVQKTAGAGLSEAAKAAVAAALANAGAGVRSNLPMHSSSSSSRRRKDDHERGSGGSSNGSKARKKKKSGHKDGRERRQRDTGGEDGGDRPTAVHKGSVTRGVGSGETASANDDEIFKERKSKRHHRKSGV